MTRKPAYAGCPRLKPFYTRLMYRGCKTTEKVNACIMLIKINLEYVT